MKTHAIETLRTLYNAKTIYQRAVVRQVGEANWSLFTSGCGLVHAWFCACLMKHMEHGTYVRQDPLDTSDVDGARPKPLPIRLRSNPFNTKPDILVTPV